MAGRIGPALAPARRVLVILLTACLALAWSKPFAKADEPPVETWLRGSGADLEMRLHGQVVDADGKPAQEIEITGALYAEHATTPLAAAIDGNRFEIWLPVNRSKWHSLWLRATDPATGHVVYETFNAFRFREAAITGLNLQLAEPTRRLAVTAVSNGEPTPHAIVQLDLGYAIKLRAEADDAGVAHFSLLPTQELNGITAWKDRQLIGGFSFNRTPTRDPALNEFTVELHPTRPQVIRTINEQGEPVPGISLTFNVATPSPFHNFIGVNEEFELTTDDDGVAICHLFPDWKESFFYPDVKNDRWYAAETHEIVDDAIVYVVHPRIVREPVRGKVVSSETSAAGFYVEMTTYQEERSQYLERATTFSDADGGYEIRVQPNATYCGQVVDDQWVGKPVDLVPFSTTPPHAAAPELEVVKGEPVELTVTTGADHRPLADLVVSFSSRFDFEWREKGEKRSGIGGASWWETTDADGKIFTHAYPGKLNVRVYTPHWRDEKTATVVAGETTSIQLHRNLVEKRRIAGAVAASDGRPLGAGVEMHAQAIDGETVDSQVVECSASGDFEFEIRGKHVGLFAKTADGALAGGIVIEDSTAPVKLMLQPTTRFDGQLLGNLDRPLVNFKVNAYARLEGPRGGNRVVSNIMDGAAFSTTTDAEGRYSFTGVPVEVDVSIFSDAVDGRLGGAFVDEVRLAPGEVRPRVVTKLTRSINDYDGALADSFQTRLRDCRLSGYRLLVIDADQSDQVKELVDRWFFDTDVHPDLPLFMQFTIPRAAKELTDDDRAFITDQGWEAPPANQIVVYALDADGQKLGRLAVDAHDKQSPSAAAEFIAVHAPMRQDASAAWAAALDEAKKTNRRVWARVSGRHCGPCFQMTRWLDEQRQLLEKDFVLLKIDESNDLNAAEVTELITGGKEGGIPFHAIVDPAGKRLIDSEGPSGNIGNASGDEGKRHLRRMLTETRQRLTDADIDELIDSLK